MTKPAASGRTQMMDIVFIMDATGSMEDVIAAAVDKISDIAFDLHVKNRTGDFQFGCVCYRDPVDDPEDEHQVHDLVKPDQTEVLTAWLETVQAEGGGDDPEDYVGALQTALSNAISWRPGSKRALIWVTDAPAHCERYCGDENHEEEGGKLDELVIRIAHEKLYFVGMSINNGADLTFDEMKKIYDAHGGPSFVIEAFSPDIGHEVDRIGSTMFSSTKRAVDEAFKPTGPRPVCTVDGCPNKGK
jgi:hypothetical protein